MLKANVRTVDLDNLKPGNSIVEIVTLTIMSVDHESNTCTVFDHTTGMSYDLEFNTIRKGNYFQSVEFTIDIPLNQGDSILDPDTQTFGYQEIYGG